jgi:regulatory protein
VASRITDIQPQKKNPKRVNISLDGKFAFGISLESKIIDRLKVGELLTPQRIQKLIFDDQVDRLYEKAIKFLSFRPRSEREIRSSLIQKLRLSDKGEEEKKNFETSVEEVINKLKKLGQVNDYEFALWWQEQRTRFKKTSPRIIKAELFKKGVVKETIEDVLAKSEVDPFQLASEAAKKKLIKFKNLNPKEFREKMGRFLASRGFDWEVVKKVVDTYIQKS